MRSLAHQHLGICPGQKQAMDIGIKVTLAQLASVFIDQKTMVQIDRYTVCAQGLHQQELPSCGTQQVISSDHQIHLMPKIIHDHRKLISPTAIAIPHRHVATVQPRALLLGTLEGIHKMNLLGF